MIRLHVTAEGQTEQSFVKKVLASHLSSYCVFADARSVLTSKDKRAAKEYRGGLQNYQKARNDILMWTKEDNHPDCRYTTMFDLYALPANFPGYADAKRQNDPYERVRTLEKAFAEDIADWRFIPYIQLHEFEALILADPQSLDWEYMEHETKIANLIKMVNAKNPELINDTPETAPSKRIIKEIPEYEHAKVSAGVSVVEKIGLPTLRSKCRHFADWLTSLENLRTSETFKT